MSDVSEVPVETREVIEKIKSNAKERREREREGERGGGELFAKDGTSESGIALLYLDCLFRENTHPTHFNLPQALACIEWIRPDRTILLGMSDEFHHDRDNVWLKKWGDEKGLKVELGFDGMRIDIEL